MRFSLLTLSAALLFLIPFVHAQAPRPNGNDKEELEPIEPNSPEFNDRVKRNCSIEFRRVDGVCTSIGSPLRQLWGSTNRPHFTYFKGLSTTVATGKSLKSPRFISNTLCKQSRDVFDGRMLNEMITIFGQFIDHTLAATPQNLKESMPIDMPPDDPLFANETTLKFFRSERVKVREGSPAERPQNSLTSSLDLASVYGPSLERLKVLRSFKDGLLATGPGNLLILNNARLNNAPQNRKSFFVAGDHRSNEHPVLTALHTLFLREHNSIAKELKANFPQWNENRLFETARQINIAQFQKIVLKEWYPAITGRRLPKYTGFKRKTDPTVSLVFSTAAFRVGHTLVGNMVNRLGPGNKKLPPFTFTEIFFRSVTVIQNNGIDQFLRGAVNSRAQKIDLLVVDALRNFLFTNVRGEEGLDLIALNLQRSRDHALPSYNRIRAKFLKKRATSFAQITKNKNIISGLQTAYGTVNRVEAWIGMMAEDHAPGSSMGPTLLAVWKREFLRIRDGDRFYYEKAGMFSKQLKQKIPRVRNLFTNQDTFRAILLRNTDINNKDLKRMFFVN